MSDAFALDNFAPPETVTFRLRKHGDHDFVVDADPDTTDVLRMLRIEEKIRQAEDELETVEAAEEGKQLLLRLIQERQPDVTELKTGMQEVLVVFSLIVRGASVAAAVANAISATSTDDDPGAGDPAAAGQQHNVPGDEVEGGAPLRSPTGASGRSSGSAEHEDGRLAIGTA